MGICVVNKSWIAVLARPKKYEIPPAGVAQRRQTSPYYPDIEARAADVW